jgi:hypothetical protein
VNAIVIVFTGITAAKPKKNLFVQEHTSGFRSTVAEQIDLGEKPWLLCGRQGRNADEDDGTSTS